MVDQAVISRRRLLGLFGAAAALPALSACGAGIGGIQAAGTTTAGSGGAVKVGLVVPQSGEYAELGTDLQRGWELYLNTHGGQLGGQPVETIIADEGGTPQTGVAAVEKVLRSDGVDVVVGLVNSATALGVRDLLAESRKLLLVTNAGAEDVTRIKSPYLWRTSYTNGQISAAMGTHLAGAGLTEGVFAIAPDHTTGKELIDGFRAAYDAGGGRLVGTATTPSGGTPDYQPFLAAIQQSGADATFCCYSGAEAITFVEQYRRLGLSSTIPLYGTGFLTEGSVLDQQADTALGVQTTLHYSDQLDNPANAAFVPAYRAAYGERPCCFAVQAYDAAGVLDRALGRAIALDGDTLARALSGLGEIDDSPRGPWRFESQTPRQNIYLRRVDDSGGEFVNTVVRNLGPQGQPAA